MRISALSNINFRQTDAVENKVENKKPEDTKKQGLSTTAKTLIGAGIVTAGTLAVYFITRKPKSIKPGKNGITEIPSSEKPIKIEKPINTEIKQEKAPIETPKVPEKTEPEPTIKNETATNIPQKPKPQAKPKEFIQGFDMSSKEAEETIKNLNPKIKNYLDTSLFSEFDDLTHRNIVSLKNGKTQVEYSGISDFGDKYKEVVLFDKNNEFAGKRSISIISDTDTIETVKTVSTQTPDKKTRIAILISDAKTNQKKKFTVNEDNTTIKEIIFGYDKDAKPSGYAYTENNQVILKLKDKKFGQVFENFEDLQANVNKEEFNIL